MEFLPFNNTNALEPKKVYPKPLRILLYLLKSFCFLCAILPNLISSQDRRLDFEKVPIIIEGVEYQFNINDITQDLQGYLWMATPYGVLKYDGYDFNIHNHIQGDTLSLHENFTETLFVDHMGDLWIGTINGLSRYKPDCPCFHNYSNSKRTDAPQGVISAITEDQHNNLWIGNHNGGLFRYDRDSDRFTRFLNDPNAEVYLNNGPIMNLLIDSENNIWIGTGYGQFDNLAGLIRFNPSNGDSKIYLHDPDDPNSLIDNRISALMENKNGQLLIGTFKNGLHYYDKQQDQIVPIKYNKEDLQNLHPPKAQNVWNTDSFVKIIHQDQQDGYWLGSAGGGINHFNQKDDDPNQYMHYPVKPNGISNNKLWSFYEDRSGQMWLGNLSQGGLHKFNPYRIKISTYGKANNWHILRIRESKNEPGIIYLGTAYRGLQQLNLKTGEIRSFFDKYNSKIDVETNNVQDVYEDNNGMIWIGVTKNNAKGALVRFDPLTHELSYFKIPKTNTTNSNNVVVYRICEDQEGVLWVGTGKNGLFKFDKISQSFTSINLSSKTNNTSEVYFIERDRNGNLWIGDYSGEGALYSYNSKKKQFKLFLEGFKPLCLTEDKLGDYWLGTEKNGIVKFSDQSKLIENYTTNDGLKDNHISAILEDPSGDFWIATSKGLTKFDPIRRKFKTNGFPQNRFEHNAALKTSDGQFIFGGNSILCSFLPKDVEGNPFGPELVLHDLEFSGSYNEILKDSMGTINKIRLSYHQNDLNFKYTALHYSNSTKNKYKYLLEPYDKNWIDAGTQRTARYTNLDPGEYTFYVIGANDNDIWSEKEASMKVLIESPWWMRWWAFILYLLFTGTIIYRLYLFQLSKNLATQENKKLHEINEIKNNLYTNITHEFRTPITVILGMVEVIRSRIDRKKLEITERPLELIERNGNKLLQLINEILDLSKMKSGNLSLNLVYSNVIPFIKYLVESFHSIAEEKDINLNVYNEIDNLNMDFDPKKLSTVITNLISNALKFTAPYGKILVHLNKYEFNGKEFLCVKVRDNGIGINKKDLPYIFDKFFQVENASTTLELGTGIGLALVKEYVELMEGSIDVESNVDKGTTFTIQIPINHKASITKELPDFHEFKHKNFNTKLKKKADSTLIDNELPMVLIIEDNADVAFYISNCLQGSYNTIHAKNGQVGLEIAIGQIPDIIISDIMMPKMNGLEVCSRLKKDERTNHIPVILLTAKATSKDRITGLSKGADAYLIKPFEKEELLIRLKKLLDIRMTLQAKYKSLLASANTINDIQDPSEVFLRKVQNIIHDHLDEEDFNVHELARSVGLSRSQLHRKIKGLSGMSTSIYIRFIRLQKARQLLGTNTLNISEIAYLVGFKSPVYFSQAYKETFGESPKTTRK